MESFANPRLAFIFGLLGNIISCLVYFAPMPTFYKIYRRRSTANFQAYPYSVALFSAMLMLYYAHLKGTRNAFLLITINSFGCGIEACYLLLFFIFADNSVKAKTAKLVIGFNMGAYLLMILVTTMAPPNDRLKIVGWICAVFSVCVFAAPLTIIRQVMKTKSVEYMPLPLSVCLTLCAVVWLFYGVFTNDYFVGAPNVLGFLLGSAQIILYLVYMKSSIRRVEASSSEMQNVAKDQTAYAENLYMVAEEILKIVNHMRNNNNNNLENNNNSAPQDQEPKAKVNKEVGIMENGIKVKGRIVHEMQNAIIENGTVVIHLHLENGGVTDAEVDAPPEHIVENAV